MHLNKETIVLAMVLGAGAFALTEVICTVLERRKQAAGEDGLDDREEKVLAAVEKIRESYSIRHVTEGLDDAVVLEPDPEGMIVPDEKPDLDSYLQEEEKPEVRMENVFDREEEEDLDGPEAIGRTRWGTALVEMGDDGLPRFSDAEWDSEVNNIELISQDEFSGDEWANYNRSQAIWYPHDGVLATESFELLEVVDTVGPTTFTTMLRNPGSVVYCKNDALDTCYEVWENDVEFEEALDKSPFDIDVRLE